jgi:hypothetical protein
MLASSPASLFLLIPSTTVFYTAVRPTQIDYVSAYRIDDVFDAHSSDSIMI